MSIHLATTRRQKRLWNQAEKIAERGNKGDNYDYTKGIYKQSLGLKARQEAPEHGEHPRSKQRELRTG
jgi:hypothetical protein